MGHCRVWPSLNLAVTVIASESALTNVPTNRRPVTSEDLSGLHPADVLVLAVLSTLRMAGKVRLAISTTNNRDDNVRSHRIAGLHGECKLCGELHTKYLPVNWFSLLLLHPENVLEWKHFKL